MKKNLISDIKLTIFLLLTMPMGILLISILILAYTNVYIFLDSTNQTYSRVIRGVVDETDNLIKDRLELFTLDQCGADTPKCLMELASTWEASRVLLVEANVVTGKKVVSSSISPDTEMENGYVHRLPLLDIPSGRVFVPGKGIIFYAVVGVTGGAYQFLVLEMAINDRDNIYSEQIGRVVGSSVYLKILNAYSPKPVQFIRSVVRGEPYIEMCNYIPKYPSVGYCYKLPIVKQADMVLEYSFVGGLSMLFLILSIRIACKIISKKITHPLINLHKEIKQVSEGSTNRVHTDMNGFIESIASAFNELLALREQSEFELKSHIDKHLIARRLLEEVLHNLEDDNVVIFKGRGSKKRIVYMSRNTLAILAKYQDDMDQDLTQPDLTTQLLYSAFGSVIREDYNISTVMSIGDYYYELNFKVIGQVADDPEVLSFLFIRDVTHHTHEMDKMGMFIQALMEGSRNMMAINKTLQDSTQRRLTYG